MKNNIKKNINGRHIKTQLNHMCRVSLLTSIVMVLVTTGCQTVTTNGFENSTSYTTNTQPSGNRERNPEQIAKARTSLAAQYIRERQLDAAMRQLDMAMEADRDYAPAYDMMGVLLQQEGSVLNLQKAESFFQKAISIDNTFTQAHNNYGVYLSQMERYQAAAQQFEIAGSTLGYEGRVGALENLGRTYLKLNNSTQAEAAFLRALDANNNSLIAHIELVDLFIADNQLSKAQYLYDETLYLIGKDAPLSPRLMMQAIKLASGYGYNQEKYELAQQLLSIYPLSDEARQLKVWLNNPEAIWK